MPARARRHQLTGSIVFHAYNRTNNHAHLFEEKEDYRHFIRLLCRYMDAFFLKIYHWCLMPTHFHVLPEMADPREISRFMAGIDRAYTHYHHRVHNASGLLWQGRFGLQPIQKERYMLACGRYIERNPVRAHLVRNAWEYPFSSARFYCASAPDPVTAKDPLLARFGAEPAGARDAYISYLNRCDPTEERLFRENQEPAGDKDFRSRLLSIRGRLLPSTRGATRGAIKIATTY